MCNTKLASSISEVERCEFCLKHRAVRTLSHGMVPPPIHPWCSAHAVLLSLFEKIPHLRSRPVETVSLSETFPPKLSEAGSPSEIVSELFSPKPSFSNRLSFSRTWNPLRRFCPLLPAFWAHRRNQQILNDYITDIIRRRWDLIQKERDGCLAPAGEHPKEATDGGGSKVASGYGSGTADSGSVEYNRGGGKEGAGNKRRYDILDKVLAAIGPREWGAAAVLQARRKGDILPNLTPERRLHQGQCDG